MQRMGMSMMTGGDAPTLNLDRETVSNMDSLLRVFGGRQQRSVRTPYREQQRLGGGQRLARRLTSRRTTEYGGGGAPRQPAAALAAADRAGGVGGLRACRERHLVLGRESHKHQHTLICLHDLAVDRCPEMIWLDVMMLLLSSAMIWS